MRVTAFAVALGLLAGIVAGGQLTGVRRIMFAWFPLLFAAGGLGLAVSVIDLPGARWLFVVATIGLLVFAAVNAVRYAGMALVFVGLALNLSVTVANAGMPVRGSALVAAGITQNPRTLRATPLHHVESGNDRLRALGRHIAVPPLADVASLGDLLVAAGAGGVLCEATLRRRRRKPAPRHAHRASVARREPQVDDGPTAEPAPPIEDLVVLIDLTAAGKPVEPVAAETEDGDEFWRTREEIFGLAHQANDDETVGDEFWLTRAAMSEDD